MIFRDISNLNNNRVSGFRDKKKTSQQVAGGFNPFQKLIYIYIYSCLC